MFNTWARSYVDRGRRLEENELFKTMHFSLCCVCCKFARRLEGRPGRGPWSHAALRQGQLCLSRLWLRRQQTPRPTAAQRPLHWPGRPPGHPRPAKCQQLTVHFQCINIKLGLFQPLQHGWASGQHVDFATPESLALCSGPG